MLWNGAKGTLFGCTFINNTANEGGGILWNGTDGTLTDCNFISNNAKNRGGALVWYGIMEH